MKILCLLGTNPYSFDRLVEPIDQLIALSNDVRIQLGHTRFDPVNSRFFSFCKREELVSHIQWADLIISQGGYGSLVDALEAKKTVIAVPRMKALGESKDDQEELVRCWASENFLIMCEDVTKLPSLIKNIGKLSDSLAPFKRRYEVTVQSIIQEFID